MEHLSGVMTDLINRLEKKLDERDKQLRRQRQLIAELTRRIHDLEQQMKELKEATMDGAIFTPNNYQRHT